MTRTSRGLRTIRAVYAYQPRACRKRRRRRAACPRAPRTNSGVLYVHRTAGGDWDDEFGGEAQFHPLYKTQWCSSFLSPEGCRFGDQCNFAHSAEELRCVWVGLLQREEGGEGGEGGGGGGGGGEGGSLRRPSPPLASVSFAAALAPYPHPSPHVTPHPLALPTLTGRPPPQTHQPTGPPRGYSGPICRYFSRGTCQWGDQCSFAHEASHTGFEPRLADPCRSATRTFEPSDPDPIPNPNLYPNQRPAGEMGRPAMGGPPMQQVSPRPHPHPTHTLTLTPHLYPSPSPLTLTLTSPSPLALTLTTDPDPDPDPDH